jgi:hypothetical protein
MTLVVPGDTPAEPAQVTDRWLEPVGQAALGSGNGYHQAGNGYAGNGHGGNVSVHDGNGNGHAENGLPEQPWTPRHSAGSPDESGWFTRPSADTHQAPEPVQSGYADSLPDGGLPVRVPQASLAPQLREPDAHGGGTSAFDAPPASADAVRDSMSALQRGFEMGRHATDMQEG